MFSDYYPLGFRALSKDPMRFTIAVLTNTTLGAVDPKMIYPSLTTLKMPLWFYSGLPPLPR